MQGDFSTMRFDPRKHFSAVLSQQGRVTLDSDVNEGTATLLHHLRTSVRDVLGPIAFPPDDPGFEITPPAAAGDGFEIGSGRMYVDGILVENDAAAPVTYWTQPDVYLDPDHAADELPDGAYLVYLRVWERLITAIQDPSIREVALGQFGPDTAARAKIVWQVAVHATDLGGSPPPSEQDALDWIDSNLVRAAEALPLLAARVPPNTDDSPCDVAPDSRYRGPENQLYRVEVHTGGQVGPVEKQTHKLDTAGAPTFKWSRENASVVFAVASISGNDVTVAARGRDDKLDLHVGDWVEIVDDHYDLRAADDLPADPTPALRQVTALDYAESIVTLSDDAAAHPLLRRWDHCGSGSVAPDGALPIVEGEWLALEDGIEIQFDGAEQGGPRRYRRGDYWWIPARVVSGGIDWPAAADGTPLTIPPDGVAYHYAPLAWVNDGSTADLRHAARTLQVAPRKSAPRKTTPLKATGGG